MTLKITQTKPAIQTPLNLNGGRWVEGHIGEYLYQAKIYACGSRFGIRDGNISKLWICHRATRETVVNYDRVWDIEPTGEHVKAMVDALVDYYYAE